MPRARSLENLDLPNRWRFTHGAYYYSVPPGTEAHWNNKKMYRLGNKFDQALREFEKIVSRYAEEERESLDKTTILEIEDILSMSKRIPTSGVYFLVFKGELVYIGRSDNLLVRIANHRNNKFIFDSFHAIESHGPEQAILEQFYISKYKPRFNVLHT